MRRLFSLAACFVIAAVLSASAQRGGMHASGGGRGGAVGHGSIAHVSGGHSFGGTRSGMPSAPHIASSHAFHGGGGFGGDHFRHHHCYGCRRGIGLYGGYPYGYGGYPYAGYYGPAWAWDAWDPTSSYNDDQDRSRQLALADEMNAENLEEQRLRQRDDRDQDSYARGSRARDERTAPGPATALVFRDQHVEEVRNYAIAGGTLWVLNDQAAKKIPLAQLDLPATVKMNDERGLDFQVPR